MNIRAEELKKTTARIFINNQFCGSGIIFLLNEEICVITAGHVVYGKDFDDSIDRNNIVVKDKDDNRYLVSALSDNIEFIKQNDIVLFKVLQQNVANELICLQFCTTSFNPNFDRYILRGVYDNEKAPNNYPNIINDEVSEECKSKFLMIIDKSLLQNSDYAHGSEWLNGLSGSGVFYDIQGEIFCTGILLEIPDKGDHGKLLCSNIKVLEELGIKLNFMDAEELDINSELNSNMIKQWYHNTTEETLKDLENDESNKVEHENINRKLRAIYPTKTIRPFKIKILNNLIIGQNFIYDILKKYSSLYNSYDTAFVVFDKTEEKIFFVETRKDARDKFLELRKKYEEYLTLHLDQLKPYNIKLITEYGISKWLANCSIDFEKDEE